jgi:ferric-dicitrate binding protein FerR (iron transport regulator)
MVIFKTVLRYAAVAILFFSIGGRLVYLYLEGNQQNVLVDNQMVPFHLQEPTLIIDDKHKIQLNEGQSEIEYTSVGEILINQTNVIQEEIEEPTMNTLVIPYGSRTTIKLSDGSKVWLNAGSKLIYPSRFVDKKREVYLVGEAFFDVEKNDKMPFVVKSSDVEVEVLGTRFNVSAYPEDNWIQTVLVEGSVNVNHANGGRIEKGVTLIPGEMASVNKKNNETNVYDVDTDYYTLWVEGLFSFSNSDLSRVIKKLERYYSISFVFTNPPDALIKVSGKLDVNQDRKEVFKYLTDLTGLEFEKINERRYEIRK